MANPSINLGNGNWSVKESKLLGSRPIKDKIAPIEFDVTRASTATRVNKQGLIETVNSNIARIDYSNDSNGALLLEGQSTNLITYSEAFDNAYWNKSGSSVVSGFTSPDGDANAFKLLNSAVTSTHYLKKESISVSSGVDYTFSILSKKGENDFITVMLQGTGWLGSSKQVSFNLANGTFDYADTGLTYKSTLLSSGFYRIEVTNETVSTSVNLRVYTSVTVNNTSSYLGDGTSGVYIWGAQLEEGSYATSYIPTSGTAQTRVAETCGGAGDASSINSEEGVLYAEISALADDGTTRYISINNGNTSDLISIIFFNNSTITSRIVINGSTTYLSSGLLTQTEFFKVAIKYKLNDYALWVNGIEVDINNSLGSIAPNKLTRLDFGRWITDKFYGNTKDLRVYNTALSDEELIYLTGTLGEDYYNNYLEMSNNLNYTIQ